MVAVTRVAYARRVNAGKYARLEEQAWRLGRVRSLVWNQYGSIGGVGVSDRDVRDWWMAEGIAVQFGVVANAWEETVRDAMSDIKAHREAAKVPVRWAIHARGLNQTETKRLSTLLKGDQWTREPLLRWVLRTYLHGGHNRTHTQIIVRVEQVRTFTRTVGGRVWLAVPDLTRRVSVPICLDTTVAPRETLRLVLRGGVVEVHHQVEDQQMASTHRPAGTRTIGVDKGYSEVLVDSEGQHHGTVLGPLLQQRSDYLCHKNACRARLRSLAEKAAQCGEHGKAERVRRHNLAAVKKYRQERRWRQRVRTETCRAVNAVVDKAAVIHAEDLTRPFASRAELGRNTSRCLAAWTKGVTAEVLSHVSDRRGSVVRLVNAAYTSHVIPETGALGSRRGDRLYCIGCGGVWQADHAAAVNVLYRYADPDIGLWSPHWRVRQILRNRDRHRSRLPDQDSNTPLHCRCVESDVSDQRSTLIND